MTTTQKQFIPILSFNRWSYGIVLWEVFTIGNQEQIDCSDISSLLKKYIAEQEPSKCNLEVFVLHR